MAAEFADQSINSVLKMSHVVFDQLSFRRLGFQNPKAESGEFSIGRHVEKTGEGQYKVSVAVRVTKKDEYEVEVAITGYCEIDEASPIKDQILNENAVAILFPYVRAEISLLTAQPETESFALPVINVSALFRDVPQQGPVETFP